MPERLQRRLALTTRFHEWEIDALLVSFLPNVRYLTGFTGSNALLALTPGGAAMFTDSRYEIQAKREVDCGVRVKKSSLWHAAATWAKSNKLKRVGLEGARVTLEQRDEFAGKLGSGIAIKGVGRVVETLRMVKSPGEIEAIIRSVQINSMAYAAALARFQAGMTEQALAAEIGYQMRRAGADNTAFDTIVASGARSALPHARPSNAPIEANRLLLIDMGALCEGMIIRLTNGCFK